MLGIFRKKNNKPYFSHFATAYSIVGKNKIQTDNYLISNELNGKRLILLASGITDTEKDAFASFQTIEVFKNFFPQSPEFPSPDDFLRKTVFIAASLIMQKSLENQDFRDAGSVLTGFYIDFNKFYTVNIGDNRTYLFRNNDLMRITKDHTLLQKLIDEGITSEKELQNAKIENKLTSAISTKLTDIQIDVSKPYELLNSDILLSVSRGIYKALRDKQLEKLIKQTHNINDLPKNIVFAALQAGSNENLTAVIYKH